MVSKGIYPKFQFYHYFAQELKNDPVH